MARRFQLDELIDRCKHQADMENDDSVPDTVWKRFLSMQYEDLFGVVAETGLRYFERITQIVSDGTDNLDEPLDMLSVVGLDLIVSATERYSLYEIMSQERNAFVSSGGLNGHRAVAYALVDDEIRLYPTPPAGQTYEVLYVYQPPDLTLEDDDFLVDVVTPDGAAFMVWGACVRARIKQERDPSLHRVEREEARVRLQSWAVNRLMNSPRRVVAEGFGDQQFPRDGDWWP